MIDELVKAIREDADHLDTLIMWLLEQDDIMTQLDGGYVMEAIDGINTAKAKRRALLERVEEAE